MQPTTPQERLLIGAGRPLTRTSTSMDQGYASDSSDAYSSCNSSGASSPSPAAGYVSHPDSPSSGVTSYSDESVMTSSSGVSSAVSSPVTLPVLSPVSPTGSSAVLSAGASSSFSPSVVSSPGVFSSSSCRFTRCLVDSETILRFKQSHSAGGISFRVEFF